MKNKNFVATLLPCSLFASLQAVADDDPSFSFAFALTGLVAGQNMRVSAVNVTPTALKQPPSVATIRCVDRQRKVLQ